MMRHVFRDFKNICSFALILGVAACSNSETILPGERISIIDRVQQEGLSVDESATAEGAGLGPALANGIFPTPGYNDGHSGGHLALDFPLERVFSLKVGKGADDVSDIAQPVVDDRAVYTVLPGGNISAVSVDTGKIIWQIDVDDDEDDTQPSISGGIGVEGNVVFAHGGKSDLYALDRNTGAILWSENFSQYLFGGPTIDQGVVVVTDVDGRIFALDAADGTQIWNRIGAGSQTRIIGVAYPAILENEIIFAGGDGELISLSLDQGSFNWGEDLSPVSLLTALDGIADITAHPVHDGGLVYALTQSGLLAVYNARTGRLVWEKPLRGATLPWLAGKTIFVTTLNGHVFAIRRNDGAVRWRAELPGSFDLNESVTEDAIRYTNPVVASGKVIITGDTGSVHIFDANTGVQTEQFSGVGRVTTSPVIAGKTLYLLSRDGRLTAWR